MDIAPYRTHNFVEIDKQSQFCIHFKILIVIVLLKQRLVETGCVLLLETTTLQFSG